MPISTPIKMSQFENVSSLSTSSYIIGLDRNGIGDLVNIRISGSDAGYELSRRRWVLNPPVTASNDSRGDDGAESYSSNGQYWIKSGSVWLQIFNSGSNITIISSSAQLVNGGGNAFTNTQQVTFNFITASLGLNAPNITSSNISVSNILHTGGSVGIGKATPNSRLDVNGNTIVTGSLTIATTSNSTYQYIINSTGTGRVLIFGSNMYIGGSTGIGTVIQSNSSNAIQIDTSQNIGIGTASPNAKLDINGNAIITGSITATGGFVGTASYALGAKSNSVYNVKDYGAVGDDSTNDTIAILSAISASQSEGIGTVYFPDGIYVITGSLVLPSNPQCDITLAGNGSNVSVIKLTSNTTAINFNMDNGGTDDQVYQVGIKGIGIKTSGQASSSIYISYGTASVSAHQNVSVDINDVHILSDNINYWASGIILESAWNFRISNVMVVGKNGNAPYTGTGLEIRRMCINGIIHNSQFNFWNTGIHINTVNYTSTGQNTEGLLMSQVYMVPVNYGIKAIGNKNFTGVAGTDWANRPYAGRIALLTLNNSHIDSRDSGSALLLQNVQSHYISNNLLIVDGTGSAVYGNNAHEGSFIGNTFFNAGTAPSVYVGGYSGSANIIASNIFRGGYPHVLLESSSIYNKVYGNVAYDSLGITIINSGSNNLTGSVGN